MKPLPAISIAANAAAALAIVWMSATARRTQAELHQVIESGNSRLIDAAQALAESQEELRMESIYVHEQAIRAAEAEQRSKTLTEMVNDARRLHPVDALPPQ